MFDKRVTNLNDDMKILRNIFSFSPVKINKSISKLAVPFLV
jgi:hypothetical protein